MIRVNDDYVVNIDDNNYVAGIDKHKTVTDKNGVARDVYDTIGYYKDLKSAIKGIYRHKGANILKDGEYSLEMAINVLHGLYKEMEQALEVVKEA